MLLSCFAQIWARINSLWHPNLPCVRKRLCSIAALIVVQVWLQFTLTAMQDTQLRILVVLLDELHFQFLLLRPVTQCLADWGSLRLGHTQAAASKKRKKTYKAMNCIATTISCTGNDKVTLSMYAFWVMAGLFVWREGLRVGVHTESCFTVSPFRDYQVLCWFCWLLGGFLLVLLLFSWLSLYLVWCPRTSSFPWLPQSKRWAQHRSKKKPWQIIYIFLAGLLLNSQRFEMTDKA